MSTWSAERPNTTCALHAPSDLERGSREWDGGTTNLTESPLVTSDHRDKEQLAELAFHTFDRIGQALDQATIEDWDGAALCLVSALQSINELRAVLRQNEGGS